MKGVTHRGFRTSWCVLLGLLGLVLLEPLKSMARRRCGFERGLLSLVMTKIMTDIYVGDVPSAV